MRTFSRKCIEAAAIAAIIASPIALAGISNGGGPVDLTGLALASDLATLQSQVTDIVAAMPQPANMAPVADASAAAIGTATGHYMLQDSVRPARYRSGTCTLSAGSCTIVWSSDFAVTPNPLGDPSIVNSSAGTLQLRCNWTSMTAHQGVVSCRSSAISLSISLGPLTLLPNAVDGLVVSGTAVPPV